METPTFNQTQFPDLDLIFAEGAPFIMGDNSSEFDTAKPEHKVQVSSFYMNKYTVTQGLWQAVMGKNPSGFIGERRPVEQVSWDNVQDFLKKLNRETGKTFRLPTEAEWEYAARGGKYSQGFVYAGSDKLKQVGWYNDNSNEETHEVGLLLSNELGLYDMSGNVLEWCEDDFHSNYKGAPVNGSSWVDLPSRAADRVLRGGSSFLDAKYCRPTVRDWSKTDGQDSDVGFRLVLPLQSVGSP